MLDRINDGSPRALAEAIAVIALTFLVVFSGVAMEKLGPVLKEWQFPALNPPPSLPQTNSSDRVIFTVSPSTNPRYWRSNAYDIYTGTTWAQSSEDLSDYTLGDKISLPVMTYSGKKEYSYTITVDGQAQGYIPTTLNAVKVFNVSGAQKFGISDYSSYYVYGQLKSYSFMTVQFNYTRDMLLSAQVPSKESASNYYEVPLSLDPKIKEISLNNTAGAKSPYEKALLLASYLKSTDFKYTRYVERPKDKDIVENFLLSTKKGNCIDFTSSFVIMARYNDLPARYVTGFALGQIEDNKRVVKSSHVHTWAEVWFEGVGWLAFEVTSSNFANPDESGPRVDGADSSIIGGGTGGGTGGSRVGKPDLTFIDEILFSSNKYIKEKKYILFVTVKNIGNGTSPPVLVRFSELKTPSKRVFGSEYIPSLAQEAEYTISLDYAPYLIGDIEVRGQIDPDNSVEELNETNNNKSAYIHVFSGVDMVLDPYLMRVIQPFVVVNDEITFEVTVMNAGDVPIVKNGRIFVYDGGSQVEYRSNISINKFDTTTVFFKWKVNSTGTHILTLNALPADGVNDLDWLNNNVTFNFNVRQILEVMMVLWDDRNGDMIFGNGDSLTVSVRNNMRINSYVVVSMQYLSRNISRTVLFMKNQTKDVELKIDFNYIEDTNDAVISAFPFSPFSKPDLVFIDNITFSTGSLKRYQDCLLYAKVKNVGNKTSIQTVVKFYEYDNSTKQKYEINSTYIPSLTPGGEFSIALGWSPLLWGLIEVTGVIDPDNQTSELNKTNNNISVLVLVSRQGYAGCDYACAGNYIAIGSGAEIYSIENRADILSRIISNRWQEIVTVLKVAVDGGRSR